MQYFSSILVLTACVASFLCPAFADTPTPELGGGRLNIGLKTDAKAMETFLDWRLGMFQEATGGPTITEITASAL